MTRIIMRAEKKNKCTTVESTNHSVRRKDRTETPTQLRAFTRQSVWAASDDVPVHYNSGMSSRLGALTYTQEKQVEVGIGKEYHPPHELGSLVQQKSGAVRTNAMYSGGVAMSKDVWQDYQTNESSVGEKTAIIQRMRNNVVQRCGPDEGDSETTLAQYGDNFGEMGTYVENPNIAVDWSRRIRHGAERMVGRGMDQATVDRIVREGKALSQNNGSKFLFITTEGSAVVALDGTLVTVIDRDHYNDNLKAVVRRLFGAGAI